MSRVFDQNRPLVLDLMSRAETTLAALRVAADRAKTSGRELWVLGCLKRAEARHKRLTALAAKPPTTRRFDRMIMLAQAVACYDHEVRIVRQSLDRDP